MEDHLGSALSASAENVRRLDHALGALEAVLARDPAATAEAVSCAVEAFGQAAKEALRG